MSIKTVTQLVNGDSKIRQSNIGVNAGEITKNTYFEASIPTQEIQNPTTFTSNKLNFSDLCAYTTHTLFNEDCTINGKKTFTDQTFFKNGTDITAQINVNKDITDERIQSDIYDIKVKAHNIDIKAQSITEYSNDTIEEKAVNGIHLKTNDTKTKLSLTTGANPKAELTSNNIDLVYSDIFNIYWYNQDTKQKQLMVQFNGNEITFTANSHVKVLENDLTCTATSARWC